MRNETTAARTTVSKRLLAIGRRINGTWEIRTFLRKAAGNGRRAFWETNDTRRRR